MASNQVNVGALTGGKLATGTQTANAGFQGDTYVSEVHGKWYNATLASRTFTAASLIAGVSLLAFGGTTGSLVLFNPVASGVVMELISFDIGFPAAATTVIATFGMEVSTQTPSGTLTEGGYKISSLLGTSATPQGKLYTAGPTITAITTCFPLGTIQTTADVATTTHYEFDGKFCLAPGGMINFAATVTQGANVQIPNITWAEWPN